MICKRRTCSLRCAIGVPPALKARPLHWPSPAGGMVKEPDKPKNALPGSRSLFAEFARAQEAHNEPPDPEPGEDHAKDKGVRVHSGGPGRPGGGGPGPSRPLGRADGGRLAEGHGAL